MRDVPAGAPRNSAHAPTDSPVGKRRIGALYIVATPIGNLEDITLRALRVLKEADVIACEDTRHTIKLLNHYQIRKRLVSYHEHNEHTRAPELVAEMEAGAKVALVSDAGMPGVSDPGRELVRLAIERGIPVVPVPGPSALTAALAASGLPVEEFLFAGFLPSQPGKRRKALAALAAEPRTLIFYEAPHRIAAMLADALAVFSERPAVVAREITKIHEEFLRGPLTDVIAALGDGRTRGEFTVLIGGRGDAASSAAALQEGKPALTLSQRVAAIQRETGMDQKAALKQAARESGLPRREAYRRLFAERNNSEGSAVE